MIGIQGIATYICKNREDNRNKIFNNEAVDSAFLLNKVGIEKVSRKESSERSSDLCVKAFINLIEKYSDFDKNQVDCLCVCTQNGDYKIPHTSAVVHGKLELSRECAVFDINLGCSGYVYSLGIMKSYMEQNGLKCGLLFTSDQYSNIIDNKDKNTSLIFGDGASVTVLSEDYVYEIGRTSFYTSGSDYNMLLCDNNEHLFMDGRMIFNFTLENVPEIVNKNLLLENETIDSIDKFIFHQASKYIVDNITRRMKIDKIKVPFNILDYGNTVSSSIPIVLEENFSYKKVMLCGFGVGLSIASMIIRKVKNEI